MDYIYIGYIINTHGIKGELRILSDFTKKDLIFQPNSPIYLGDNKQQEIIETYRPHKKFDMITLKNYENINDVLPFLKMNVYIKKSDLNLAPTDYLIEELIDYTIIENQKNIGKVTGIVYNKANILLKVKYLDNKVFYIPFYEYYIVEVNTKTKQIITQNIQGLIL